MPAVWLNRRFSDQCLPVRFVTIELSADVGRLEHRTRRRISLEMVGIDFDALDDSELCKPDNRPVVARPAASFRFPSIAHVSGSPGKNEILSMTVVHVAALNDVSATFHCSEVHLAH